MNTSPDVKRFVERADATTNTCPDVKRFVERADATTPANTLAKADEEGDSYEFSVISSGHYACVSGNTTHFIIETDGKIGCSCGDMTHRCYGTYVCKHITTFLKLDVPPQTPAPGELIQKLKVMGWVGGENDLRPSAPSKPAPTAPDTLATVVCPHCKTRAKRKTQEDADAWLDHHLPKCRKNPDNAAPKAEPKPSPPADSPYKPEEPEYPDAISRAVSPEPPDNDSNCKNTPPLPPLDNLPPATVPTNLASALCNMQKVDLLAVTDSANPFHNAKYADLASVWAAIRKPLTDNGLAVIQTTEQYPQGVTVVTTLVHISGETFISRLSCEVPKSKPDKNGQMKPNIQGLGSTITYLRRYSLAAMVGVAPVDDDGEAAMNR